MVFDAENIHRRKSSLVHSDAARLAQQKSERRKDTAACFVHKLLEKERQQRKAGDSTQLKDILEDRKQDKDHGGNGTTTHSRLLTKKQLSDMAWGVRELSKKLGSIRLKLNVQTVFLLTKAHDEELIGFTRRLTEWLLSSERTTKYTMYAWIVPKGLLDTDPVPDMSRIPWNIITNLMLKGFWNKILRTEVVSSIGPTISVRNTLTRSILL